MIDITFDNIEPDGHVRVNAHATCTNTHPERCTGCAAATFIEQFHLYVPL